MTIKRETKVIPKRKVIILLSLFFARLIRAKITRNGNIKRGSVNKLLFSRSGLQLNLLFAMSPLPSSLVVFSNWLGSYPLLNQKAVPKLLCPLYDSSIIENAGINHHKLKSITKKKNKTVSNVFQLKIFCPDTRIKNPI
ncbi:MAG: hypothetical protein ACD_37C00186G0002 [uncultured bacterium]|nr:MAG: hypothetical protein ACD_37C00186G0002 [uncultured bacterium]